MEYEYTEKHPGFRYSSQKWIYQGENYELVVGNKSLLLIEILRRIDRKKITLSIVLTNYSGLTVINFPEFELDYVFSESSLALVLIGVRLLLWETKRTTF
jgi:hypothetical protein